MISSKSRITMLIQRTAGNIIVKYAQIAAIVPRIDQMIMNSVNISTSFQVFALKANRLAIPMAKIAAPAIRPDASSLGQPVTEFHSSGARKNQAPYTMCDIRLIRNPYLTIFGISSIFYQLLKHLDEVIINSIRGLLNIFLHKILMKAIDINGREASPEIE